MKKNWGGRIIILVVSMTAAQDEPGFCVPTAEWVLGTARARRAHGALPWLCPGLELTTVPPEGLLPGGCTLNSSRAGLAPYSTTECWRAKGRDKDKGECKSLNERRGTTGSSSKCCLLYRRCHSIAGSWVTEPHLKLPDTAQACLKSR